MKNTIAITAPMYHQTDISNMNDIVNGVLLQHANDISNIPCAVEFTNIRFSPKTCKFTADKMSIGMNIILNNKG
jgi:hypothetical protein